MLWLENLGQGRFREHLLLTTQGPSHVPVADFDGEGRPDFAVSVSQDHEEVWLWINSGGGQFTPRRIFRTPNFDLGSAGVRLADLDGDGPADIVGGSLYLSDLPPLSWGRLTLWLRQSRQP